MHRNRRSVSYKAKDREAVRQKARELRKKLQIDESLAPDLYYVLLRLNSILPGFKFKKVADGDLPRSDARAYCKAGVLKIRASILHSLSHYGDGRARWTVAHELGHLVLEHPKSRLDRKRPSQKVPISDQVYEREADVFAAEFLAPSHLAAKCASAEEIRMLFQISPRAALLRKQELEEENEC